MIAKYLMILITSGLIQSCASIPVTDDECIVVTKDQVVVNKQQLAALLQRYLTLEKYLEMKTQQEQRRNF